jgi:hypothetical protein
VGGQPYTIKGVGYQPTPIGSYPPPPDDLSIYDRDFPLLVDMGCNTIRTWGVPGVNLMGKADEYGLKVIAGIWIDLYIDFTDPVVRDSVRQQFTDLINTHKDSPALLMWAIGSQNNYHNGSNEAFYSLCDKLAEIAYQLEGGSYHPVIIPNGHLFDIGVNEKGAEDMQLNYIDAWGCNVYTDYFHTINWHGDARSFFGVYKEKSSKPVIITEYGTDAFCSRNPDTLEGYVDEYAQADWVSQNTIEIINASDVCLGGSVMAYSDEWWKDPEGDPATHDPGGFPSADFHQESPDGFTNEEYWGIVEIAPDGMWNEPDGLDDIRKRMVYKVLEAFYTGKIIVVPGESIQEAIDISSGGGTIYVRDGIYEEDIYVKDKGSLNLIGESTRDTIIQGNVIFENTHALMEEFRIYYNKPDRYYTDYNILPNAGITAVNSEIEIKGCAIIPYFDMFPWEKHGNGIQIWNMYGSLDIAPIIEDCGIFYAENAIYLYSQHMSGAINGVIYHNWLEGNTCGITLRMHKENPFIEDNYIFDSTEDAIHITYEDGDLLTNRLNNITNNFFIGNNRNVYCDELNLEVTPTGPGNVYE